MTFKFPGWGMAMYFAGVVIASLICLAAGFANHNRQMTQTYFNQQVAVEVFEKCMAAPTPVGSNGIVYPRSVGDCQEAARDLATTVIPPSAESCLRVIILSNPVQHRCQFPTP